MNTPEIDIHTYPENATPRQLADYRHAVELAVLEGKTRLKYYSSTHQRWFFIETNYVPLNWKEQNFCIARDPLDEVAPGHNPEKYTLGMLRDLERITGQTVRLLTLEEVRVPKKRVDWNHIWTMFGSEWNPNWSGLEEEVTYATTKPPGYFLPNPEPVKQLIPYTAGTFPKGEVWIKNNNYFPKQRFLVINVFSDGVGRNGRFINFTEENYSISLDGGRTWQPFRQEVVS